MFAGREGSQRRKIYDQFECRKYYLLALIKLLKNVKISNSQLPVKCIMVHLLANVIPQVCEKFVYIAKVYVVFTFFPYFFKCKVHNGALACKCDTTGL